MGKLDYLSKYSDPPPHKHNKKKKSKKRHRKDDVLLNDDDDLLFVPVKDEDGDNNDDEDRPVVVNSNVADHENNNNNNYRPKQEWEPVLDLNATRKRRYESDNDEQQPSTTTIRPNDPSSRRKRYDSDSDSDGSESNKGKRRDLKSHKSDTRKRFDSDDDNKATVRKRYDSDDYTPPSRGKRLDSDDDKVVTRKRYDSENDGPSSKDKRFDSDDDDDDKGFTRKKRYDSDDDESSGRNNNDLAGKKRYDSDDDESSGRDNTNPKGKKQYDSDDDEPSGRDKRFDSDGDKAITRNLHDSDDDERSGRDKRFNSTGHDLSRWQKYASASDNHSTTSRNRGSENTRDGDEKGYHSDKSKERRALMSSGHAAGLQKSGDFRDTEVKIQEKRRREAQAMVDKHGMGETVYRNEFGQKVDSASATKVPHLNPLEETELRKGRVQKEQEANFQYQFRELQNSTFARHADDEALEDLKKDVLRKGDPMAAYAAKKKILVQKASGKPVRPVYKGPPPKPNRFGIRPGYRWDGVDRGNGFEDKALASKFSTEHKKEQAYRWSTSDM